MYLVIFNIFFIAVKKNTKIVVNNCLTITYMKKMLLA